jgi:hypothetical protein
MNYTTWIELHRTKKNTVRLYEVRDVGTYHLLRRVIRDPDTTNNEVLEFRDAALAREYAAVMFPHLPKEDYTK